mmetsp:Transcript_83506/g.244802  ORF Transcript_83506/g.244802 Transcript_83506/m.244802 type:complete len:248 (-) Transcript_83506:331-1074(-)
MNSRGKRPQQALPLRGKRPAEALARQPAARQRLPGQCSAAAEKEEAHEHDVGRGKRCPGAAWQVDRELAETRVRADKGTADISGQLALTRVEEGIRPALIEPALSLQPVHVDPNDVWIQGPAPIIHHLLEVHDAHPPRWRHRIAFALLVRGALRHRRCHDDAPEVAGHDGGVVRLWDVAEEVGHPHEAVHRGGVPWQCQLPSKRPIPLQVLQLLGQRRVIRHHGIILRAPVVDQHLAMIDFDNCSIP